MLIRAGGRRWSVESTDCHSDVEGPLPFVDLTFRDEEDVGDRIELRWVPRPDVLTPTLAERLFELAGRRIWMDDRTGRRYEVEMMVSGPDEEGGCLAVRFLADGRTDVTAPYPLARPLGLASTAELEAMVDVAQECSARAL